MGMKIYRDNHLFDTKETVSVECLKDDKMQVVFYTLRDKECINIVPDDYSVTSVILILEGRIRIQSGDDYFYLDAHDSIMLTDIEESYFAQAEGSAKLLAISSEENQDPEEDEELNQILIQVEKKDVYTLGHSKRVSLYAKHLALAYQSNYDVISLSAAACMHDIGKINTPIDILQKPEKLTKEEFEQIKLHPSDSYELLKNTFSEKVAKAALQHHERIDGSGYPYGLKSDEICMDAKIIAIADVFDAMTCKRTYNEPKAPIEVVEYLEKNVDKYDSTFISILRSKVEKGDFDDIVTSFVSS